MVLADKLRRGAQRVLRLCIGVDRRRIAAAKVERDAGAEGGADLLGDLGKLVLHAVGHGGVEAAHGALQRH